MIRYAPMPHIGTAGQRWLLGSTLLREDLHFTDPAKLSWRTSCVALQIARNNDRPRTFATKTTRTVQHEVCQQWPQQPAPTSLCPSRTHHRSLNYLLTQEGLGEGTE